jgi:acetoin utilization deacetylase AcuC-like enzyme
MWIELLQRIISKGKEIPIWYDPSYWLPLSFSDKELEPRRADFVAWYLTEKQLLAPRWFRAPGLISYQDLALVHTDEYIEKLSTPEGLAKIFAVPASGIAVDSLLYSIRASCGATLAAARESLVNREPSLNLLGGFHHAAPSYGGGFCAFNDIAVAIAVLRREGFKGQCVILDLDAHPPDGTAHCLESDPLVYIASLSGAEWGSLPRVDEIVLQENCGDETYLTALQQLLTRLPSAALTFVIAGGDVLQGDTLGNLALSLTGAKRRDMLVAKFLRGIPSVWVPGGGYHKDSWKVLTNTALVLLERTWHRIPNEHQPLVGHFSYVAGTLFQNKSTDWLGLTEEDLNGGLHPKPINQTTFLGYYYKEGLEHALVRYGLWERIERLGYKSLKLVLDKVSQGDRLRLFSGPLISRHNEGEQLLVDCIADIQEVSGHRSIFVHWLNLRHPLATNKTLQSKHPLLPGQDVPGLGVSREVALLFRQIALRLGAEGVALCPAWYHVAYSSRQDFQFIDPSRQGRFEAMLRDFATLSASSVSRALVEGKVLLNNKTYQWEATEMASWVHFTKEEEELRQKEKEGSSFQITSA